MQAGSCISTAHSERRKVVLQVSVLIALDVAFFSLGFRCFKAPPQSWTCSSYEVALLATVQSPFVLVLLLLVNLDPTTMSVFRQTFDSDVATVSLLCVAEYVVYTVLAWLQDDGGMGGIGAYIAASFFLSPRLHFVLSVLLAALVVVSLVVAYVFYKHACKTALMATFAPATRRPRSFLLFLQFIRPVHIVWRFATFTLRVTPDVYVARVQCMLLTSIAPLVHRSVHDVCFHKLSQPYIPPRDNMRTLSTRAQFIC